jgi:hypothetical protein
MSWVLRAFFNEESKAADPKFKPYYTKTKHWEQITGREPALPPPPMNYPSTRVHSPEEKSDIVQSSDENPWAPLLRADYKSQNKAKNKGESDLEGLDKEGYFR